MQNARIARWLVGLGFLVMFLSSSFKSVFQVYFNDLARYFGRGRADLGFAGGLFLLVSGLCSPMVGALSDRIGPIRTAMIGSLMGGAAFILMAAGAGPYWGYGIFVGMYGLAGAFALAAMTYVPMGILVDRLFEPHNKGFAYAVITNGTSIGFIVLSPLWLWLQPQWSWQQVFAAVGLLFVGPIALLLGFGARIALPAPATDRPTGRQANTWSTVRRDPGFYVLAFGFFGCGASMAFIDVHLVPFWQDAGASRASMGLSLSLLGILELISGLAAGWLAIRFPQQRILAAFYLLRGLAMLLLLTNDGVSTTYLFAIMFGASYLGTVILTSAICLERYGSLVKGQIFGMLFLIHQVGAFASAQLGAYGHDRFHSYQPIIIILSLLTALAGIASLLLASGTQRSTRLQSK
jgi:MFS family permease